MKELFPLSFPLSCQMSLLPSNSQCYMRERETCWFWLIWRPLQLDWIWAILLGFLHKEEWSCNAECLLSQKDIYTKKPCFKNCESNCVKIIICPAGSKDLLTSIFKTAPFGSLWPSQRLLTPSRKAVNIEKKDWINCISSGLLNNFA